MAPTIPGISFAIPGHPLIKWGFSTRHPLFNKTSFRPSLNCVSKWNPDNALWEFIIIVNKNLLPLCIFTLVKSNVSYNHCYKHELVCGLFCLKLISNVIPSHSSWPQCFKQYLVCWVFVNSQTLVNEGSKTVLNTWVIGWNSLREKLRTTSVANCYT